MKTILIIIILFISFNLYSQNDSLISFGQKIKFSNYTVIFDKQYKQAKIAYYILTKDMLPNYVERQNYFYYDKNYKSYKNDDFKYSGFDRGHLVPSDNMQFSKKSMKETFQYVNITLQYPSFNRGIWKKLENKVKNICELYDTVYIVTGPIFDINSYNNKYIIPKSFFKVLLYKKNGIYYTKGYIIPNFKLKRLYKKLKDYTYSVNFIEFLTGYDFFPFLNDNIEEKTEKRN